MVKEYEIIQYDRRFGTRTTSSFSSLTDSFAKRVFSDHVQRNSTYYLSFKLVRIDQDSIRVLKILR